MYGTGQPREQPQIGDRGSNPGSGSQSVSFSIGPHVFALLFHLLTFIILRGLLHLILF